MTYGSQFMPLFSYCPFIIILQRGSLFIIIFKTFKFWSFLFCRTCPAHWNITITARLDPCRCRQLFQQMELFVGVLLHFIMKLLLVLAVDGFQGNLSKSTSSSMTYVNTTSQQSHTKKRKQTETFKPRN